MTEQGTEQRIRAALAEIVEADWVPVEAINPRKWPSAVLAAAAVAAIVAVIALTPLWPGKDGTPVAGADGRPSLPERLPSYSWVQGSLDGPFGRAIALYNNGTGHEDWGFWQVIVAGADRDSVRRIDAAMLEGYPSDLARRLSPDGTKVAIGGEDDRIRILDLITGATRAFPVPHGMTTAPLAISPDGRRLAFASFPEIASEGTLYLLDLDSGVVSSPLGPVSGAAAFSPDGTRLAVHTWTVRGYTISVIGLDGELRWRQPVEESTQLSANSWSPDGKFLVTMHYSRGYRVLDAENGWEARIAIPADVLPGCGGEAVLGWRSPTVVLLSDGDVSGTSSNLITEVDLANEQTRVLSRFDVGKLDDLAVCGVQLATALVPEMVTRPGSDPDRGTWPLWAVITAGVASVLVLLPAALWMFRRRRTRV
ncbi:MAG TPA: hypothetical protein VF062_28475 [Candidatus Limnocylindrales bacterium]